MQIHGNRKHLVSLVAGLAVCAVAVPSASGRQAVRRTWKLSNTERAFTFVHKIDKEKRHTSKATAAPGDLVECGEFELIYQGEAKIQCVVQKGILTVNGTVAGLALKAHKPAARLKLLSKHRKTIQYLTFDQGVRATAKLRRALGKLSARWITVSGLESRSLGSLSGLLGALKKRLFALSIMTTSNEAPDFKSLERYRELRHLDLFGETKTPKNLSSLGKLTRMRSLELTFANLKGVKMSFLGKLKKLRKLELGHTKIADSGVRHIGGLTSLRELRLDGELLTTKCLSAIVKLKQLTRLSISDLSVDDPWLTRLGKLRQLRYLTLTAHQSTDQGLRAVTGLSRLETLTLDGQYTDRGVARLAMLKQLKKLSLSSDKLTGSGLRSLTKLKNLIQVSLSGKKLNASALAALSGVPKLQSLILKGPAAALSPAALRAVAKARSLVTLKLKLDGTKQPRVELSPLVKLSKLRTLSLSNVRLGTTQATTLGKLTGLESLWLSGTGLADAGIAKLQPLKKLKLISFGTSLKATSPTDASLASIATLPALKTVLATGRFTDKGLARLAARTTLTDLSITLSTGKGITHRGLKHLRRLKRLRILSLSDIQPTKKMLQAISRIAGLTDLSLMNDEYRGAGLANLHRLRKLRELSLIFCPINDAALMLLTRIRSLQKLDLTGTKVTDAGIKKFLRKRPDVSVEKTNLGSPDDEDGGEGGDPKDPPIEDPPPPTH